ncbi:MAG: VOC family protein [Planctomycetota bacterium]
MAEVDGTTPLLAGIDRLVLRVANFPAAVRYYRDTLGLELRREGGTFATFRLPDGREILLHDDDDLPGEGVFLLVDDVRALHNRRNELRLTFMSLPSRVARGYKATCRDPFGTVLLLIDRSLETDDDRQVETAATPDALFPGVAASLSPRRELLAKLYKKAGRTADDLPYTPQFETIHTAYAAEFAGPQPDRRETWRHLLSLRKRGQLPRLGAARDASPVDDRASELIRSLIDKLFDGKIGRRDRLPYSEDFETLRDAFNAERVQRREPSMSPHALWRLVAKAAK